MLKLEPTTTREIESRYHAGPSLALTFVAAGIAYALPILLFPESHPRNGPTSPEILNLYLVVAWMGLAHFVYAYAGQARSMLKPGKPRCSLGFLAGFALGLGLLLYIRTTLSQRIFDALIWVYFIPHFIKAEVLFQKSDHTSTEKPTVLYWFPMASFAFFTIALHVGAAYTERPWLLILGACALILVGLLGGVHRQITNESLAVYSLFGFFLIGEGLVWGTYAKYMTPQFREGVYAFHVAMASFYHYFRCYGYARRRTGSREPISVSKFYMRIIAVNLGIGGLGYMVLDFKQNQPLNYILDIQYFTFWVGLHLVSSDVFSWVRTKLS